MPHAGTGSSPTDGGAPGALSWPREVRRTSSFSCSGGQSLRSDSHRRDGVRGLISDTGIEVKSQEICKRHRRPGLVSSGTRVSRGDPYSQALALISGYENTTGEPRTDAGGTKKAHDTVSEGR